MPPYIELAPYRLDSWDKWAEKHSNAYSKFVSSHPNGLRVAKWDPTINCPKYIAPVDAIWQWLLQALEKECSRFIMSLKYLIGDVSGNSVSQYRFCGPWRSHCVAVAIHRSELSNLKSTSTSHLCNKTVTTYWFALTPWTAHCVAVAIHRCELSYLKSTHINFPPV